jgi:hypothetical protein
MTSQSGSDGQRQAPPRCLVGDCPVRFSAGESRLCRQHQAEAAYEMRATSAASVAFLGARTSAKPVRLSE